MHSTVDYSVYSISLVLSLVIVFISGASPQLGRVAFSVSHSNTSILYRVPYIHTYTHILYACAMYIYVYFLQINLSFDYQLIGVVGEIGINMILSDSPFAVVVFPVI